MHKKHIKLQKVTKKFAKLIVLPYIRISKNPKQSDAKQGFVTNRKQTHIF